jgi:hypothetical protein
MHRSSSCASQSPKSFDIVGSKGFLTIRLAKGTTVKEGEGIAEYLQEKVVGIAYTRL